MSERQDLCPDCRGDGLVRVPTTAYSSPGEGYAPCHCPAGEGAMERYYESIRRRPRTESSWPADATGLDTQEADALQRMLEES